MRIRFFPKKVGQGRAATWRVYDQQRGSFPYQTPELGIVAQDHPTEKAAQVEADRLTAAHGGITETPVRKPRPKPKADLDDD